MSKPMSEQMQKLAARYEKATGKKFNAKTNAQKIRSMTDEELAKLFEGLCYDSMAHRAKYWLHWLQQPAAVEIGLLCSNSHQALPGIPWQ